MMKLPPLTTDINCRDYHVDGTPDGKYALRILKLYRERAKVKWVVSGLSDGENIIYDHMNATQDERAKELDKAIDILSRELKMTKRCLYHMSIPIIFLIAMLSIYIVDMVVK